MEILKAAILGIIQGFTEFFPVSSSGHLVIVPFLFGWKYIPVYFAVMLHLATVFSLVAVLYREIWRIIKAFFTGIFNRKTRKENRYFKVSLFIIIASVPAAAAGFLAGDLVEGFFSKPLYVAIFLIVTAALLFFGELTGRKIESKISIADLARQNENPAIYTGFSCWKAIIIGVSQAIAILPGISRSGATISTGRFLGLKREDSVRFSMLLSIPVILGAFVFEAYKSAGEIKMLDSGTIASVATGFIFAFLSGYIAIRFLVRFSRTRNLNYFAIYCIVIAIIVFILSATKKI